VAFRKKQYNLHYNEASLVARQRAVRGSKTLNVIETLHQFSKGPLQLPPIKRTHHEGTNAANAINNIVIEPIDDVWQLPFGMKKKMYGKARVPVGGKSKKGDDSSTASDDGGIDEVTVKRNDDVLEPAFFRGMPYKLCVEMIKSWNLTGIIHTSAGDMEMAVAAVEAGVIYTGICLTELHVELGYARLEERVWELMQTEGNRIYSPQLAVALKSEKAKKAQATTPPPNPKKKAKAAPKKKKKANEVDLEASEAEDEESASDADSKSDAA